MPISLPYGDKNLERLISREEELTSELKSVEKNLNSHLSSLNKEQVIQEVLKQNFGDIALIDGIHGKKIYVSASANPHVDGFEKHLFEYKCTTITTHHKYDKYNDTSDKSEYSCHLYFLPFVKVDISVFGKVITQQKVFSFPYAIHVGDLKYSDILVRPRNFYMNNLLFERNPIGFKQASIFESGINPVLIAEMLKFDPEKQSQELMGNDKKHNFFYDSNGKKQRRQDLHFHETGY